MFDITSMLGSTGSNDSSGSFNFSDYAAIKNGSYGKLVKSYYQGTTKEIEAQKATSTYNKTNASKTTAKDSAADTDKTGLTQMKKDADQLKASAEALGKDDLWKKTGGKEDTEAIVSAVKNFANDYNKVIDQAGKVNSKEISQDMRFMTGMTDTFTKALGKIGITVGTDGKMSVDEEAVKKADSTMVKSLFAGNATYGSQIADKAATIAKDTDMNTSIYGSDATTSSALSGIFNQFI